MKKHKIQAAELRYYNANNRGNYVGDCVKRSISLAFDITYNEVTKLLNAEMKRTRHDKWNIPSVFGPVIHELGGSDRVQVDSNNVMTVEQFADNIAQPGKSYVVLCGKHYPSSSHMVCIRDKEVWDSWDCLDWEVCSYYEAKHADLKGVTSILDNLTDLCKEYATPVMIAELEKWMNNKDWEGSYSFTITKRNYTVKYSFKLTLIAEGLLTKNRNYSFIINLVFEPTMTEEDAIEYINKIAKQRMYDRMYTIYGQEKKLIEEAEVRREAGIETESYEDRHWLSGAEQRFMKSLPGWIKPLITYLSVQNPGMYSDSYRMTIVSLPSDTLHPSKTRIEFEGMDANEIKWQIDRYKKTYEAPFIDYYPADEY